MRLLVISPSKDVQDETIHVTKMFESGLTIFHLRKPKYSTGQMIDYLKDIPAHFHNRIVIHSHHQLALKFNLKGIHLTGTHLSKKWKYWFVRQRLKLKFGTISKSRSYSKLQDVYGKEDYAFSYFLIGTIYNKLTNEFYSGFYEEGLKAAVKNSGKKLVARGGTTPACIKKSADLGFYGIAYNSFIWESKNPYISFMEILSAFQTQGVDFE